MEINLIDPSPAGSKFLLMFKAMQPSITMPVDKSYAFVKDGLSLQGLRDIAEHNNVGKLAIVVIEHDDCFEVRRLPDGCSTKLFYRYLDEDIRQARPSKNHDCKQDLKRVIDEYKNYSLDECLKYDQNLTEVMKKDDVISYAYMQRRVMSLVSFRKAAEGGTETLKKVIDELKAEGEIADATSELYKVNAKLYRLRFEAVAPEPYDETV